MHRIFILDGPLSKGDVTMEINDEAGVIPPPASIPESGTCYSQERGGKGGGAAPVVALNPRGRRDPDFFRFRSLEKRGGKRENRGLFSPPVYHAFLILFRGGFRGMLRQKRNITTFPPFLQLSPLIVFSSPRLVACFSGETVARRRKGLRGRKRRPLLLACLPLSQHLARFFPPSIPQSLQGQNEEGGGWQLFWTSILFFAGRREQTYFLRGWVP